MQILLSIKPKFAKKILSGEKRFEFRKSAPKKDISRVLIYSSAPVKKIIASVLLGGIISDSPPNIWRKCKDFAGITKEEFNKYFSGKKIGYALVIESIDIFPNALNPLDFDPAFRPPQSFMYCNESSPLLVNSFSS